MTFDNTNIAHIAPIAPIAPLHPLSPFRLSRLVDFTSELSSETYPLNLRTLAWTYPRYSESDLQ